MVSSPFHKLRAAHDLTELAAKSVAAGIKSARPARLSLWSRMAGVVADSTLTLLCFLTFELDIEVDLAYFNNCLYRIISLNFFVNFGPFVVKQVLL